MIIKKVILHILDFNSNICVFSQKELDFSNDNISHYIEKHIEKALIDPNKRSGEFLPDSIFSIYLQKYNQDKISFIEFSTFIANMLYEQISKSDKLDSIDFLVVDFSNDNSNYFALLLLSNKIAYTHEVINDANIIHNQIIKHYAILPNTSQKIGSFAIINKQDLSIDFIDKNRMINGKDVLVLPDQILQCKSNISTKEAVKIVKQITTKVADEHGANSTVAISKAKNFIVENSEVSSTFSPIDLGQEVFSDSPIMQNEFENKVKESSLPNDVKIDKNIAVRTIRKHKIKTDTGIELTFPADYFENHEYIEFINNPNGTISIELKNIGQITNR
jgi:hypothetical protein